MTNKTLKLNEDKLRVLKVKDKTDKLTISVNQLFDLPFRLILTGKTGSGKGAIITNLLLNDNYGYNKVFKEGDDIFIFAPSPYADEKMKILIEEKDVPDSNIFEDLDDLEDLYDTLVDDFKERVEDKEELKMKLIIVDDFAFSGKLQNRFNALAKVYCNSRKFLISIITTAQAYTQIAKTVRLQSSGMIIFQTSNRELEVIEAENNYLEGGKKRFYKMFRDNVKEKHDFICINYTNNYNNLYLDKNFKPLLKQKEEKEEPEKNPPPPQEKKKN